MHHALIRTHHVTSRKKVAALRAAARALDVAVLVRSGGAPGVMYVEGGEAGVRAWVAAVQRLKYKDYRLAARPASIVVDDVDGGREARRETKKPEIGTGTATTAATTTTTMDQLPLLRPGCLEEVASVKDFGAQMRRRGLWRWWRTGMGFTSGDDG